MHQDESFCWATSMPQTDDSPSKRAESDYTLLDHMWILCNQSVQQWSYHIKFWCQYLRWVFTMIIYDGAKAVTDMNQLSDSRCLKVGWDESHYEIFPISRVQSGIMNKWTSMFYRALVTFCINFYSHSWPGVGWKWSLAWRGVWVSKAGE